MAFAIAILPYLGPLIAWFIANILRDRVLSENWTKSYMGWLKFDQNQIPIAATEKNRVRAQIEGIKKLRAERKAAEAKAKAEQ